MIVLSITFIWKILVFKQCICQGQFVNYCQDIIVKNYLFTFYVFLITNIGTLLLDFMASWIC